MPESDASGRGRLETPEQELARKYGEIRPLYEELTGKLERLLRSMLEEKKISCFVGSRTKDLDHFVEKALRPGKNYSDPLAEVSDLSGLRVVVQSLDDADTVVDLVANEFEIDPGRSIDKSTQLDPDRFGYLSRHYVVRVKSPRADLLEWRNVASLWAELQIRTVLQDAWAQVSHFFEYKSDREIPQELRRRFHAIAALLEIGDRELNAVIADSASIAQSYAEDIAKGAMDLPLDASSLSAFMDGSSEFQYWQDGITGLGFSVVPRSVGVSNLILAVSDYLELRSVADLEQCLARERGFATRVLERLAAWWKSKIWPADAALLNLLLFVAMGRGLTATEATRRFQISQTDRIFDEVQNVKREFGQSQ